MNRQLSIMSVLVVAMGILAIPFALLAGMTFDAPGAIESPRVWIAFAIMTLYPFLCFGAVKLAWYFERQGKRNAATRVIWVPVLIIMSIAALTVLYPNIPLM